MDDIGSTTYLLILILLLLSAFFSASETAFSAANMIRLRTMAEDGHKRAAQAVKVAAQYDKLIATILIGNNLVNICCNSLSFFLRLCSCNSSYTFTYYVYFSIYNIS